MLSRDGHQAGVVTTGASGALSAALSATKSKSPLNFSGRVAATHAVMSSEAEKRMIAAQFPYRSG
jgi:hypothetical protein